MRHNRRDHISDPQHLNRIWHTYPSTESILCCPDAGMINHSLYWFVFFLTLYVLVLVLDR